MSLKNLKYALLLDEYRKELKAKEKEVIREEIRKNSNITVKDILDLLEKSIDKINNTK
ncbi:hypothetical protein [Aquimarina sp. I32.4]|uniref:hypothetical protein n=1 Tax=Aquimarina sp. I32.4 TaxID=2053903 RepID=UPI001304A95B|nr:hypothetical protein [Aquimarina sp. I32.4]